jgi:(1->4)-alpha-D-glucan 1-alpha-D-glucosylmutase
VVVEKILTGDEQLPREWPVHGTTGYDFMNLVNGLFVDPESVGKMDRIYRVFTGGKISFDNLVYRSKKIVMHAALASELNVLANALSRIALANRHTCDFTLNSLKDTLSRIVACFPVYRTYISGSCVSETDRRYVQEAVDCAKRQSRGSDPSVFDFVQDALLLNKAESQGNVYRKAVTRFAMKAQQFTSAVMAKGLEDTSFYRYHRLDSLNEVGGDPRRFGVPPEVFHEKMVERSKSWPHTMLDTSSHDTKRSEDVRARIDVISEIPHRWGKEVRRWRELNQSKKRLVDDVLAPSRNDEYLLYQTLVGSWPLEGEVLPDESFRERIKQYMLKAVREAKEKSSWANPNANYESAVVAFVDEVLAPSQDNTFVAGLAAFSGDVARIGMLNSMSQTLLKLTCPGVPDLYQGTELWDLSLVDPDNRRPVDYSRRGEILKEMQTWPKAGEGLIACVRDLVNHMGDGRIKMYLTWRALNLRKENPKLFTDGDYVPLGIQGPKTRHLVAFARSLEDRQLIVVVPRLSANLLDAQRGLPAGSYLWGDTRVEVGREESAKASRNRTYRNIFTAKTLDAKSSGQEGSLPASALFEDFPVAALISE